jgi:hypothetical protein
MHSFLKALVHSKTAHSQFSLWRFFQIFPGPRFENHLINEHGIIFDIDYIISLSVFKEENQVITD